MRNILFRAIKKVQARRDEGRRAREDQRFLEVLHQEERITGFPPVVGGETLGRLEEIQARTGKPLVSRSGVEGSSASGIHSSPGGERKA